MKLDKKDRRIMYELDKNARQTYSQISKKVGLSQESVRYRVNRLMNKRIINKFLATVNVSKLNSVFYKILLRLHNVDQEKKNELIEFLVKDKNVSWTTDLDGSYDIGIVVNAKSIIDLNNFLENIYQRFHNYISKHDVSINFYGEYLSRDYLINKTRVKKEGVSYAADIEPYKADSLDLEIIKVLCKDGRVSAIDISKKIKLSIDSVLQRMRRLERDGIITKYILVLNHEKIDHIHYKVLISLSDFSPHKITRFLNHCRSLNRIVYLIKALGNWNYELDIEVESIDQFRSIMMQLTKEFSDLIKDYDSLIVRKTHKYNYYP